MDLFEYEYDKLATEEGRWFDLNKGARVKIRSVRSEHARKTKNELQKPYLRKIREGNMDEKTSQMLMVKLLANSIILDWDGIKVKGEMVSFSPSSAEAFLTKYEKFLEEIAKLVADEDNFLTELDKETLGN